MINLLSVDDLSINDIENIFARSKSFESSEEINPIRNQKQVGLLFFEPSTRTRVGFETAAWKLGVKTLFMDGTKYNAEMSQAESISDTIRTLDPYVDLYCIRHKDADILSESILPFTNRPVINCGNGYDEHPTQALIDAYTIRKKFQNLQEVKMLFVGALRYSRSAHSLVKILNKYKNFNIEMYAPRELELSSDAYEGVKSIAAFSEPEWERYDVVYVAGFAPRNPSGNFRSEQRKEYILTKNRAKFLREDSIILCPLPRVDEIEAAVDEMQQAYYFKQNSLGLFVRMALLEKYLNI